MSNVLNEEKKQQVIALGRLGWSLRRIEAAVHIRRETVAGYLRAMGIPVRPPGGWGKLDAAKPAIEVITDFGAELAPVKVLEQKPLTHSSASISAAYCGSRKFCIASFHGVRFEFSEPESMR